VDIEEDYFAIDPTRIEAAITKNTKAILPVHLYGHPADMPAIMALAAKHKLVVIEDCAQSHGARVNGKAAGTFGHAASFSFYPGKNLGAYGDAGCMATNDPAIAEQARMIAQHGQKGKHNHLIEGRNSRLDGLQAAILLAKLPHLDSWTDRRITNAAYYDKALKGSDVCIPKTRPGSRHVYHLYVIRTKDRSAVQAKLEKAGVETAIHYPTPLPFLPCYAHYGHKPEDFPVATACQHTILSIPMFAELTQQQMDHVASILKGSHA
jgi:dTDP-4-amino-4,6-dideoxygalactose transaminase